MRFQTYLRSEVKPQVGVVAQSVLHQQWHLVAETQLDLTAQATCFAKVDEVLEREGKSDRLGQVDLDVLAVVLNIRVRAKSD